MWMKVQLGDWLQNCTSKMLAWRHLLYSHSALSHHGQILHFSCDPFVSVSESLHCHFLFHHISFLEREKKKNKTSQTNKKCSKGSHLQFQYHHAAVKPFFCHLPCSSEFASSTVPHTNSLRHVTNVCEKSTDFWRDSVCSQAECLWYSVLDPCQVLT